MTTAMAKPEQTGDTAGDQRTALLRRVGVAGLMIALLIGGLALFDASRTAPDDDDEEVSVPAPAPGEAVAPPAMPEVPAEATPASIEDSPPPLPETDVPETGVPEAGAAAEAAATPPAAAAHAPASAAPAPAAARAPAARTAVVPESTARPEDAVPESRAAPAPAAASAPPAIARTPAPAPASGFLVQAGVFSSTTNAEELRARLVRHGIPAQIESRVQVGPFRTRAEADNARARMRALGMDSGPPTAVGGAR